MLCFPAVWLTLMLWCTYGMAGAQTKHLVCAEGNQRIIGSWTYDDTGTTCEKLIGLVEDKYHPVFVNDCRRWMGHADQVEKYRILGCWPDGSRLRYNAEVCCAGPIKNRCFKCEHYTNRAWCRATAPVVDCEEGEVCGTTYRYVYEHSKTTAYGTTGCYNATLCTAENKDNKDQCRSWLPEPQCTYCCRKPFCNYYTKHPPKLYAGHNRCQAGPCQNGGTCNHAPYPDISYTCTCPTPYEGRLCEKCVPDPCDPSPCKNRGICVSACPSYTCKCRIGSTGKNCESKYDECSETITQEPVCENGGTCYDHDDYGKRCECPENFVGTRCEILKPNCSVSTAYRQRYTFRTFANTTCTERLLKDKKIVDRKKQLLHKCTKFMVRMGKPRFLNGVDGRVNKVESVSHVDCSSGDEYTFRTLSWCCPSCHSMPCLNGARCTQTEDNDYRCWCRRRWYGKNCQFRRNLCEVSGDPHYVTFDEARFSLQGGGSYRLCETKRTASDQFQVSSTNERIGQVSYLSSMRIVACHHDVILKRNNLVTVNDTSVDPASERTFDCLNITMNGAMMRMQTTYGLVVEYDGHHIGFVHLPTAFMREVMGLCGNFDSFPKNDWRGSSGAPFSNDIDREYKLEKAWVIGSIDIQPSPVIHCTGQIKDTIDSNEYCGHLKNTEGIFKDCFADEAVNNATDLADCQYDVCANKDDVVMMKRSACEAMESLIFKCKASRGKVPSWREKAGCPLICEEGFVKKDLATACPATCRTPNAPATCKLEKSEGCVCPEGRILNFGKCILPTECECFDQYGNEFKVGQSWSYTDRCNMTKCQREAGKVAELVVMKYTCPGSKVCFSPLPGKGLCIDDPCLGNLCKRNGKCVVTGVDDYECLCRVGTSGNRCWKKMETCNQTECGNRGTCYHHDNPRKDRCECNPGYVGTKCETPVLKCFEPKAYRKGITFHRELGKRPLTCTLQMKRMQKRLDIDYVIDGCKRHMIKEYNLTPENWVQGNVDRVESRSLSECAEGDKYLFAQKDYCCPTCFSMPCQGGGTCSQKHNGDYECKCPVGRQGKNCEENDPMAGSA